MYGWSPVDWFGFSSFTNCYKKRNIFSSLQESMPVLMATVIHAMLLPPDKVPRWMLVLWSTFWHTTFHLDLIWSSFGDRIALKSNGSFRLQQFCCDQPLEECSKNRKFPTNCNALVAGCSRITVVWTSLNKTFYERKRSRLFREKNLFS